jgi:predicted Zn finger-like uncharacterized protein
MMISCTSCKSKYLVNSADLKPDGRTVQCAKCGNQWYQYPVLNESDQIEDVTISSTLSTSSHNQKENTELPTPNLPSTYVREKKVSIINSILVVLFVTIIIGGFWIVQNLEVNNFVLLEFYFNEFTFNLNLIFEDISKIIYHLFNWL